MADNQKPGYQDGPYLPGRKWRVHDSERPQPPVVTPGKNPGDPPSDAIVLFDGTDLSKWKAKKGGGEPGWKVENGYMEVVKGTGYISTKESIGDCQLHIEWMAPAAIEGESQGRGNSGVFLMGRYEIQVLDNHQNPTYPDGTAGAIYGQYPPLANACRAPGEWQVYDIVWEGPKFDGTTLLEPAYLTLFFNGVLIHNRKPLLGPTGHRDVYDYVPHPPEGPLELQDHSNPVRFRNIWYRPLKGYDEA